jgi:hypothetical protein
MIIPGMARPPLQSGTHRTQKSKIENSVRQHRTRRVLEWQRNGRKVCLTIYLPEAFPAFQSWRADLTDIVLQTRTALVQHQPRLKESNVNSFTLALRPIMGARKNDAGSLGRSSPETARQGQSREDTESGIGSCVASQFAKTKR